ncbi:MAG: hypothetical protein EA420_01590 [Candidatus Competibacteraceae bacterium]|nr:MAG: hypothetical protein EA420_01590 [Candidatus Competibacteraceae bacterium]
MKFGVDPHGQWLFDRSVERAAPRALPVWCGRGRQIGPVAVVLRLGGQRRQCLADRFRDLVHGFSSPVESRGALQ